MKKKHILKIDLEHDYFLIGIKSVLEDYRLAYYLNKNFDIRLKKEDFALRFSKKEGDFPVFGFDNLETNSYWALIGNKQHIEKQVVQDSLSLFDEISNTYVLISEEKTVDYFLKIDSKYKAEEKTLLIKKINTIHRVMTSYEIDPNTLKSKDFLIF